MTTSLSLGRARGETFVVATLINPEIFRTLDAGSPDMMRNLQHPNLKSMRNDVVNSLTADIDALLKPLGYEKTGLEWRKTSFCGMSLLQIQRSRYGFGLFINVGRLARGGPVPTYPAGTFRPWFVLERPSKFCPELRKRGCHIDELYYLRLHEDPAFRNAILTVVRQRMIPWLEVRHSKWSLIWMPSCQNMAKVPLFAKV